MAMWDVSGPISSNHPVNMKVLSIVFLHLILCFLCWLPAANSQVRLVQQSPQNLPCPGSEVVYQCTVPSTGVIWNFPGGEITLLPASNGTVSGNFQAQPVGVVGGNFTSTLTFPVESGTVITCTSGDRSLTDSQAVTVKGPPSAPTLSCVILSEDTDGAVNVTVSWTPSGRDRANSYLINITTNDPQPPYEGLLTITTLSDIQWELTGFRTGYEYNITVRGVNCGSQEGIESEPLTITPQVPTAPSVTNVSAVYRGTIGTLQTIETTWNEVDPVTVSVDCMFGQDIDYEVVYTSSSGIFNTTCVVNGMNCNDSVCCHVLQNNINNSRCQPPVPQFNSESVTVTVTARNIVGRSNSTTLMTPVPSVCAEYDRTGTLLSIESTWNETDIGAIYELSYTSSSGTNMTTCVVNETDCSNGVCRHELQNNTAGSECDPPMLQFNGENVTLTMSTRNIDYSVSRSISGTSTLRVDVDSTNTANAFVECTFEPDYNCTIVYGIDPSPSDPSYTNLVYNDTSSTMDQVATIILSQDLETNTLYSYIVSAMSISLCARVRGTFRTGCTVSDLRTESDLSNLGSAAQGGMRDQRCDGQFGSSLPICNGVVCYNGITAMSEAIYICDDTFSLMGETPRRCENDGNWNPQRIPQCTSPDPLPGRNLPLTIVGAIFLFSAISLIVIVTVVFLIITEIVSCCKKPEEDKEDAKSHTKEVKIEWRVLLNLSLMTVAAVFSAIGVGLWIAVGVVASNPPMCSLSEFLRWRDSRDGLVISGFVFSILGIIYAIAAMIWVVYMKHEKQPSGKRATFCMVVMIVLLCLSVVGIPFVPIVLYFWKVEKGATWCIVVMIILLCLSVVGILFAFIVYYMHKKQGDTEDTDGGHELKDVIAKKEEEQYSTLQHGKPASPLPLLTSDQTYAQLGEHDEAAGDVYSQTRHDVMPHAVPNPEDPNYSHFKEGGGGGKGGGVAQEEYSQLQHSKPPRAVPKPNDPSYSSLQQGTKGASRPPAEDLQYDVVANAPRYTPSQKEKEEGKGKGKRQK